MGYHGLTAWRLREILHYYPDTGQFQWAKPGKSRRVRVGCVQWTNIEYTPSPRLVIRIDGRLYKAHRLAWLWMTGVLPESEIDHINQDPLDNRWRNLRIAATRKESLENRGPYKARKNKSGITGVYWQEKSSRWIVEFKGKYIGCYRDKAEAVAVRQNAAQLRMDSRSTKDK